MTALDDVDDPSKPTTACWVGNRSNCFAVGYDDGSIIVWGVPASTLKGGSLLLVLRAHIEECCGSMCTNIFFAVTYEGTIPLCILVSF